MGKQDYYCALPSGQRTTLAQVLQPEHITAFVGAGGKTHTMFALAYELAADGKRVIVTTTTHIFPPLRPLPPGITVVGVPRSDRRLGGVEDVDALAEHCDYLLIEADGSRCHPVKAPAAHEPVLTQGTQLVVGVLGLSAIGQRIGEISHRTELVCEILDKEVTDLLSEADAALLLSCEAGQRKAVGQRRYAVVLNQADDVEKCRNAREIAQLLGEIPCVVTAYGEELR